MSIDNIPQVPVSLIGAGCAGLSLAARAVELPNHQISLVTPSDNRAKDHVWGFWSMPWLQDATSEARKKWLNWRIISNQKNVLHRTKNHPYCAIHRHHWLEKCRKQATANGVQFERELIIKTPSQQILDSRPPAIPKGIMLQHFVGWEVKTPVRAFDQTTAILMDFRCDQALGMHFIYCLPFSGREALIESTLFSTKVATKSFYETAITNYLQTICEVPAFEVIRHEFGIIPLGSLARHDPRLTGIGANGGAIRPSSGYAFSFIQKQIEHAVTHATAGKPLSIGVPHSAFELWMDHIFLAVLRRRPDLAPSIFTSMAAALTGDEFASFLSGEAGSKIWLKVILAMPKLPFLQALINPEKKVFKS